ncbi:MAG: ATP-dependent DNA helicase [Gammaproteobacteria bacterium]|nr:ATP-dependent DNA helicase [Gammaproteobacteria bacterium]
MRPLLRAPILENMQELQKAVARFFAEDGLLARNFTEFQPRTGQKLMAQAVSLCIQEGGALVVEAGTGLGKTFAYLVPALLSHQKVIISTASKILQEQLYKHDLPKLKNILSLPISVGLLKGKANYVCLHKLAMLTSQPWLMENVPAEVIREVKQWEKTSYTGDIVELLAKGFDHKIIPSITTTSESCIGKECEFFTDCRAHRARKQALACEVVIINHHLFFADQKLIENAMGELLPKVDFIVFDEAHKLNDIGVQFIGIQCSTLTLTELAKEVEVMCQNVLNGRLMGMVAPVKKLNMDIWEWCHHNLPHKGKYPWSRLAETPSVEQALQEVFKTLADCFTSMSQQLLEHGKGMPDILMLAEKLNHQATSMVRLTLPVSEDWVRWIDWSLETVQFHQSPMDISSFMQTYLLKAQPEKKQSWLFTSATLGHDKDLKWFVQPTGLENNCKILSVPSPFNFQKQATLFLVSHEFANPQEVSDHQAQVAKLAWFVASLLQGRTLVLTTTRKSCKTIGELVSQVASDEFQVLIQGEAADAKLVHQFKKMAKPSILLGTANFWQGIDIPGIPLQAVIIDKLPFPPPEDPRVQAYAHYLKTKGKNAFRDYFLPEATVVLKQGIGRLIRHENDHGLVVVCDKRLAYSNYRHKILQGLPPMLLYASQSMPDLYACIERTVGDWTESVNPE